MQENQGARREFLKRVIGLCGAAATTRGTSAAIPQRGGVIHVNAANVVGRIRSLQGVNDGPLPSVPLGLDVSRQYRDLHIDFVRTHDFYGPTDIDAVPPDRPKNWNIFPRWDADPGNEASYDFDFSDRYIKAILDCGARVYYRVGRSWGARAAPPEDFDKFADICKHVVMHYNGGWASGFHFNIRHWEFWNEPDTSMFWTGTPTQFYQLYEKAARKLKAYDPKLMIGGCGLAAGDRPGSYREGFIQYCAARKVPLDFFSWHYYEYGSGDPYNLAQIGQTIRSVLDSYGFRSSSSYVTEWGLLVNPETSRHFEDGIAAASYISSALIYLQDAPVDLSFYYRGDSCHPWGMFGCDRTYWKKAYAYKAAGMMLETPERLQVSGANTSGLAVLAGRSKDGRTVQVFISRYVAQEPSANTKAPQHLNEQRDKNPPLEGYRLAVDGVPWGEKPFEWNRYRVSDKENFSLVQKGTGKGGRLEIKNGLSGSSIEVIVLKSV
jgi:hypothetical protein